jgi:hypothetical protein
MSLRLLLLLAPQRKPRVGRRPVTAARRLRARRDGLRLIGRSDAPLQPPVSQPRAGARRPLRPAPVRLPGRLAAGAALLLAAAAGAHDTDYSYLHLRVERERIEGRWEIHLRDARIALGLPGNREGPAAWAELRLDIRQLDVWRAFGD